MQKLALLAGNNIVARRTPVIDRNPFVAHRRIVTEWAPIETQRLKILIQETINGVWFRVAMSS